jgi:hypothetical protein
MAATMWPGQPIGADAGAILAVDARKLLVVEVTSADQQSKKNGLAIGSLVHYE